MASSFLATLTMVVAIAGLGAAGVHAAGDAEEYAYEDFCEVCVVFRFMRPPTAALAYPPNNRFFQGQNYGICHRAYDNVTTYLDDPLISARANMLYGFADGSRSCSWDEMMWCAGFYTSTHALRYKTIIMNGAKKVISDYFCREVVPSAYGFTVRSEPGNCFPINITSAPCRPAPIAFPKTTCNKTQGTTRVAMSPNVTLEAGRSNLTKLYCLNITEVPAGSAVQSKCNSTQLARAEIWADDSKRSAVKGLRVTRNGGTPTWGPAAWGAVRDNALKIGAPLLSKWNMTAAIGSQICIELSSDIRLGDLCLGGSCYVSLFNEKGCCPTYPVTLRPNPNDYDYYDYSN